MSERSERQNKDAQARLVSKPRRNGHLCRKLTELLTFIRFARRILSWHFALRARCSGWTPHRSGTNTTAFDRRAIFLTYNPKEEGEWRGEYYRLMGERRRIFKEKLKEQNRRDETEKIEDDWLSSVPK